MTAATLHDGRVVPSDSEEWRAECEARYLLRMEPEEREVDGRMTRVSAKFRRLEYLNRVEKKRGEAQRAALADLVMRIWEAERSTR